jgi:hypothetical protein
MNPVSRATVRCTRCRAASVPIEGDVFPVCDGRFRQIARTEFVEVGTWWSP